MRRRTVVSVFLLIALLFFGVVSVNQILKGNDEKLPSPQQTITVFSEDKTLSEGVVPQDGAYVFANPVSLAGETLKAIGRDGSIYPLDQEAKWLWRHGTGWSITSQNASMTGVIGLYVKTDGMAITDVYQEVRARLDAEERVLVILLDGFSYNQYQEASRQDLVPFLETHFVNKAISVFTPVTNAGFAAMITGQTPNVNGIHDRSMRTLAVESLFGYVKRQQKQGILLEGDIKILNTEIDPELHTDLNGDGDSDDEIFQTAQQIVKGEEDLIFIHFHGIDDRGHLYGPNAEETLAYIKKMDATISTLYDLWDSDIVITADHGMHKTDTGGSHGLAIQEDMIVPFFIVESKHEKR